MKREITGVFVSVLAILFLMGCSTPETVTVPESDPEPEPVTDIVPVPPLEPELEIEATVPIVGDPTIDSESPTVEPTVPVVIPPAIKPEPVVTPTVPIVEPPIAPTVPIVEPEYGKVTVTEVESVQKYICPYCTDNMTYTLSEWVQHMHDEHPEEIKPIEIEWD